MKGLLDSFHDRLTLLLSFQLDLLQIDFTVLSLHLRLAFQLGLQLFHVVLMPQLGLLFSSL